METRAQPPSFGWVGWLFFIICLPPFLTTIAALQSINPPLAAASAAHRHSKRCRLSPVPLDSPADELLFLVLDRVAAADPRALKSFALASRACHARRVAPTARPPPAPRRPAPGRAGPLPVRVPPRPLPLRARPRRRPRRRPFLRILLLRAVDLSRSSGFGAAGIAALARACPCLADLDLSNGVHLGDAAGRRGGADAEAPEAVSVLTLVGCIGIDDDALSSLEKEYSKSYRFLIMSHCQNVTDVGVSSVVKSIPNLLELNLSYCCPKLTDRSLMSLSKCTKLNTLEIRGCPRISSAGLSEIAMGCRLLSKLDIKKCFEINDVGMLYLSQFSHALRQVLGLFKSPVAEIY
ncbi:hypothetical protein HU200_011598 [Digitaria exilis]|uniref:F-box/LRR-repeat protein 15-like leucin rich repeat domain-containing protein n=1 Tax=Digitaria exilis TaxID=1010633 RepID=A0A835KMK2_9POAL|nr:hypothetical protein HU200_011598 [Digitaria exilis]